MAVRDIYGIHPGEPLPDSPERAVRLLRSVLLNDPDPVSDAVLGDEAAGRRIFLHCPDDFPKHRVRAVSQEDGACLHVAHVHMADSVLFLVRPGVLMLLDDACIVVVNGGTGHDAGLAPALHGQLVEIIAGPVLPDEFPPGDPIAQQSRRPFVHLRSVGVHLRAKACLRPVYGQEGVGISGHHCRGLLPVVHIIGQCGYPALHPRRRAVCGKRSDICHCLRSSFLSK